MSARERILARVRDALEGRAVVPHPGRFGGWRSGSSPTPPELFTTLLEAAGGEVMRFESSAAGAAWVRSFVSDFDGLSVGTTALSPLNAEMESGERLDGVDPAVASVGVSLALGAVAETGSLIMSAADGRRAQLLPPTHVVLVDEGSIYPTLADALEELSSDLPSAIGLHSGPSKSADIGQVLVKGVHGPGRLIAVIGRDPTTAEALDEA